MPFRTLLAASPLIRPVDEFSRLKFFNSLSTEEIRRVNARRVFTRQQAVSGWRANRVGGVAIGKPHRLCREVVDVWRVVKAIRIVDANIHITKIVNDKHDDVGLVGWLGTIGRRFWMGGKYV